MSYRNGAGALISLTFDDGLPSQVQNALPILNHYGVPATFFLIAAETTEYDTQFRADTWRDAIAVGHEIGSHSVNHRKAAELTPPVAQTEATFSAIWLKNQLKGYPVGSFCYPYTDAPDYLQQAVRYAGYEQARGGRVARQDKYLEPGDGANLLNIPCFHVGPETVNDADEWLRTAVRRGAWLTLMLHGVGCDKDWDNLSIAQFTTLVDKISAASSEGLMPVTFREGGALYRAGRGF